MLTSQILRYYQKCYEADKGRNSLWSVLAKDTEFLHFVAPIHQENDDLYEAALESDLASQIDATAYKLLWLKMLHVALE